MLHSHIRFGNKMFCDSENIIRPSLVPKVSTFSSVSVFVFVTLGCCHFARPRVSLSSSSSVYVFVCPCLRHSGVSSAVMELPLRSSPGWVPSSSSVSVFARLRHRLSLSSSVSVVVPGGWSRGRRLSVRWSTSRVWKPPWRARSKCVHIEFIIKRFLLFRDLLP